MHRYVLSFGMYSRKNDGVYRGMGATMVLRDGLEGGLWKEVVKSEMVYAHAFSTHTKSNNDCLDP